VVVVRDGETVTLGRDDDNTLVVDHPRVSRRHAALMWADGGWRLEDLGSKNGTSVNGLAASGGPLQSGDWISLGGVMGRFERLADAEVAQLAADREARRRTAVERTRRLSADLAPWDLLLQLLDSAIEMVDAERAFVVVVAPDGRPRVEAVRGYTPAQAREGFAGSFGVLERVFESGASVVVANAQADPALRGRPSVAAQGLGTVACVPLTRERRIVGALYLDSRRAGAGFTELDLEMLEALAEHAGVLLAGIRLDERIRALVRAQGGAPEPVVAALDDTVGRLPRPSAATDVSFRLDRGGS
jgi:hypothetical protein